MARSPRTIVAIVSINYYEPDITSYQSVTIQDNFSRQTLEWNSGDVLNDFASALNYAKDMYSNGQIDEIILHESCETFIRDSKRLYAFDAKNYLVQRFVYD